MLTVTTYTSRAEEIDTAEGCETVEGTSSAARTLWEDSVEHGTGVAYAVVCDGDRRIRSFTRKP